MNLVLDGPDWQLTPLVPFLGDMAPIFQEDWEPQAVAPPSGRWIPAVVPGDVVADSLDAGLIPEPYVDLQSQVCEWLSQRDWVYRKRFEVPAAWAGKTLRLGFEGVDHACRVYLNGKPLGDHEGMFIPFEFNVTDAIRPGATNTLTVLVRHAPSVDDVMGQIGWTSRARTWKSRFAYGWDWCTRLVPVGIWKSVTLMATEAAWIDDVWVRPTVTEGRGRVEVRIQVGGDTAAGKAGMPVPGSGGYLARARVFGPDGDPVAEAEGTVNTAPGESVLHFEVASPRLWYPNGLGEQALYRVEVELVLAGAGSGVGSRVSDSRGVTFGFRTIEFAQNDNVYKDAIPYTFVVNGQRIFVKGFNWVPIDHMYGRIQLDRYEHLLSLVRHSHGNLLRVWGGGLIERTEFYDLCDRLGILVWQEFHQSSSGIDNIPPQDDAYVRYAEAQARQIVPQRRNHACLALWCGGNELMVTNNVPCDDSHPVLARLKAVVEELDPGRGWLPTSASGPVQWPDVKAVGQERHHDIHGPWHYQGPVDHYTLYNAIDCLGHSEFGVEGAANLRTIERYISPAYRFPPDASNPMWVHHGSWWMHREKLEGMAGRFDDLESFVRASQWVQAEGYRYAIESHRRRMGACSHVMPWQFNEAFPNTACTNAVDYLGIPKPAYWSIRRAFEPLHGSLKYARIAWKPGDRWEAEAWLTNEGPARFGLRVEATLMSIAGETLSSWTLKADAPAWKSDAVGTIAFDLPSDPAVYLVFLSVRDGDGAALARTEYLFSTAPLPLEPLRTPPPATVRAAREGDGLTIQNSGNVPALFVNLEPEAESESGAAFLPSDNYLCLAPGETRRIASVGEGAIRVTCWNAAEIRVEAPAPTSTPSPSR